MRVVTDSRGSNTERRWPAPRDKEFVKAAAGLLGFVLRPPPDGSGTNFWYLESPKRWLLYGTLKGEIQGPWIPETDDEWIACLQRLYKEGENRRWARNPEVFDDVFRKEHLTYEEI